MVSVFIVWYDDGAVTVINLEKLKLMQYIYIDNIRVFFEGIKWQLTDNSNERKFCRVSSMSDWNDGFFYDQKVDINCCIERVPEKLDQEMQYDLGSLQNNTKRQKRKRSKLSVGREH